MIKSKQSPVPWIGDDLWTAWNPGPTDDGDCPIVNPQLCVVTDEDKTRSPIYEHSNKELPPTGDLKFLEEVLATTPIAYYNTRNAVWPVCCNTLCTLENSQGLGQPIKKFESDNLNKACLENELKNNWHGFNLDTRNKIIDTAFKDQLESLRLTGYADGINIFHCRSCGHVFIASCHP